MKIMSNNVSQNLFQGLVFTGSQVNYFFVCWRKLWFFSRYLDLEADSDLVLLGKLLHETGYPRKFKEVSIGRVKIDFLEHGGEIEKIKISLKKIINENEDSIILYKARNKKWITKEILGTEKSETTTII